jgi:hypothetical protein
MGPHQLQIKTVSEAPPLEAAKWLKCPLLIDENEMKSLLNSLGNFYIFSVSGLHNEGEGIISIDDFLDAYRGYIESIKSGGLPDMQLYRPLFSAAFTVCQDHLCAINVEGGKQIIRIIKPVVQLQPHSIDYSTVDGKFRSMVFGTDSIHWGIQFSYPQLFHTPETKEIKEVRESPEFPDGELFKKIQKWARYHTQPTTFVVENEKKITTPVRIGNHCLSWINRHQQLKSKRIIVA